MAKPAGRIVRAAGGVVWRRPTADGPTEVLVVHRPRYDDWSLPKGKCDRGETDEACALREVQEETGLRCALGAELASAAYEDRDGRAKSVRYWAMTVVPDLTGDVRFEPNHEVDRIEWLPVDAAVARLTYPRDGEVLRSFTGPA